jgi:hypothetical protein
MRFPRSKILTCVIGVVTVLPLVFSAVMLVSTPVVAGEGESFTMFRDVNQDGRLDIVTPTGIVYYNVGDNRYRSNEIEFKGTGYWLKEYAFSNGTLVPYSGQTYDMEPSPLSYIDQDDDGIPETIIFTNYGDLSMVLYRSDGTGSYSAVKTLDIQADVTPEYIAVFDDRDLREKQGFVELL